MSTSHARSVFANSCLSTPRKVEGHKSKDEGTQLLNSGQMPEEPLHLSLTPSTPYIRSMTSPSTREALNVSPSSIEGNERPWPQETEERREYAALFSTLLESNALLLEEIRALKNEQQSTISTVQELPNKEPTEQERLCQSLPPKLVKDTTWVVPSYEADTSDQQSSATSTYVSPRIESDRDSHWSDVIEDIEPTDAIPLDSDASETNSSEGSRNPFASPGALAVNKMWENFSVDDYNDTKTEEASQKCKKQWTPRITVPEPFSMTVRESQTPKQKSRSLRISEEEQLQKDAEGEAELMKKFRASPVPASTFLPIFELVNAKNQQRREEVKQLSKDLLKSKEKPFSFTKREQDLKHAKARQAALLKEIEDKERRKKTFKAKPVPKHLFSPVINEHIREQEEYRKIRMQMRSKELLASSRLPGTMQLRDLQHQLKRKKSENRMEQGLLFHPNINGTIPDYDQAYCEFQKRLAVRKRTKPTTAIEPFFLHTEHIPTRKQQVVEGMQRDSQVLPEDRWPFVASRVSRKSSNGTKRMPIYPAQMTQTARMRKSLTQEKLAIVMDQELNEQEKILDRKRREKELTKSVFEKSISSDSTALLEERKKQKLREFRKLDRERKDKYQQQLDEIQERVQSRPLLLEQASLLSARSSAEAKFIDTLKKAGLSDQEIQAL